MERTGKKMGRGERREMMGETGEFEVTREVLDSPSEGSGRCSCLGSELAYTFPHICSSPPSLYPLIVCLLCPSRVSLHHLIVLPKADHRRGVGLIDIFKGMGGFNDWHTKFPGDCSPTNWNRWAPCQYWCDKQSCDQCHLDDYGYHHFATVVQAGLGLLESASRS